MSPSEGVALLAFVVFCAVMHWRDRKRQREEEQRRLTRSFNRHRRP